MKIQDLVKLKPIIDAIERGETIQFTGGPIPVDIGVDDDFSFCPDIIELYRIKPKPREWTVAVHKRTGLILGSDTTGILGPNLAMESLEDGFSTLVRVREVIE